MGADYVVRVIVRYALLLLAGAVTRMWVLPVEWEKPVAAAVLLYVLVVVQTEPSAWLARRAKDPWILWTFLYAVCVHALSAAVVYALSPITEPRFVQPDPGPLDFEPLWYDTVSTFAVSGWVMLYALASGAWALLAGWAARFAWGAAPPEQQVVRIRRRTAQP